MFRLTAPWLDLPTPLPEKILERLPLSDYIRFAAVCRLWCSIQAEHRQRHAPILNLPWFVSWMTARCYSPFEGRSYRIPIPGDGFRCFPNGGWLLRPTAVENPFSRVEIQFPAEVPKNDAEFVVVSSPPERIVFLITSKAELLICRSGDRLWTRMQLCLAEEKPEEYGVGVSTALAVGGKLYCIVSRARYLLNEDDVELVTMVDHLLVIDPLPAPPTIDSLPIGASTWRPRFLVESGGDVLLVTVIYEGVRPWRTMGFTMFKANVPDKTWTRVEGLGDRLLILNRSWESVSLLAADVGLRGNCIYFLTHVMAEGTRSRDLLWRRFDLDSGTMTEVPFLNGSMITGGSNLVMPSIY